MQPGLPDPLHPRPTMSKPRWLTGSRCEQAFLCPASMILPEEDSTSAAAIHGTQVHSYIETGLIPPAMSAGQQDRLKAFEARGERAYWWPKGGEREVRLWYNPVDRTAGFTTRYDIDSFPRPALTLVSDYVHGLEGGLAWVDDLKTGWQAPPPVCPQTLLGALCLWRIRELAGDPIEKCTLTISHWPRYPLRAPLERKKAVIGVPQLEAFERRIWETYGTYMLERSRQVQGEPLTTVKGDHCKYCKCRKACPEWAEMYCELALKEAAEKKKGKKS